MPLVSMGGSACAFAYLALRRAGGRGVERRAAIIIAARGLTPALSLRLTTSYGALAYTLNYTYTC